MLSTITIPTMTAVPASPTFDLPAAAVVSVTFGQTGLRAVGTGTQWLRSEPTATHDYSTKRRMATATINRIGRPTGPPPLLRTT